MKSFLAKLVILTAAVVVISGYVISARAADTCWGIAYSPCRADQKPDGGPQPTEKQIEADMVRLSKLTTRIRTYTVAGSHQQIPTIANRLGMRTWLGCWLGKNLDANDKEIARVIEAARQPGVEVIIVGNEAMYNRFFTQDRLIAYIKKVKSNVQVPVAYADSWQEILSRPKVVEAVDIAIVNIHPYWVKKPADDGVGDVIYCLNQVKQRYPGKRIVIGETGWPSAGPPRGEARASQADQATFVQAWLGECAKDKSVEGFVFSAYDEYWKIENHSTVGMHWGIHNADGSTKAKLVPIFGACPATGERKTAAGEIISSGSLAPGLCMGVATNSGRTGWVKSIQGALDLDYPAGQQWGAVFVVVGDQLQREEVLRGVRDYSAYNELVVEIKGARAGETVDIGLKTPSDRDDGSEPKYTIENIPDKWTTYRIPMASLCDSEHPDSRFDSLYVVVEFVFNGSARHRIYVRDVRFADSPSAAHAPTVSTDDDRAPNVPPEPVAIREPEPGDVCVGAGPVNGLTLGADTSGHAQDWVTSKGDYVECSYPRGQSWGAVFFTVGEATNERDKRQVRDYSAYKALVLEMKGAKGGEAVAIGVKTDTDRDNGLEPKFLVKGLTTEWTTVRIDLGKLTAKPGYPAERFKRLYVPCEMVFESWCPAETICFRNIRFEP